MEDYKEEMQLVFSRFYSTTGSEEQLLTKTTGEIWDQLRGVIPSHPIDEHDVYEMLKSQGYEQDEKIYYEKKCIVPANKEEGITAEYDQVEIGRQFIWKIYQK